MISKILEVRFFFISTENRRWGDKRVQYFEVENVILDKFEFLELFGFPTGF